MVASPDNSIVVTRDQSKLAAVRFARRSKAAGDVQVGELDSKVVDPSAAVGSDREVECFVDCAGSSQFFPRSLLAGCQVEDRYRNCLIHIAVRGDKYASIVFAPSDDPIVVAQSVHRM